MFHTKLKAERLPSERFLRHDAGSEILGRYLSPMIAGQGKFKRLFSRKPKERKVPEVNVLPTPVLVPPEEEPGGPEGPPPVPDEVPVEQVAPPPMQEPPTGEELLPVQAYLYVS